MHVLMPVLIWMCCLQFGVVREGGANKAFGAGILSSYGEMEHMASVRLVILRTRCYLRAWQGGRHWMKKACHAGCSDAG